MVVMLLHYLRLITYFVSTGRVRFLSYAGLPFVPGLPSLYLSIKSVRIVYKTHRHLQRSHSDSIGGFSQFGMVSQKTDFQNSTLTTSTVQVPADSVSREQIVPAISSPALASRQFHLPFKTIREHREPYLPAQAQETEIDDRDSTISMSFPAFTGPGHMVGLTSKGDRPTAQQAEIHGTERPQSSTLPEFSRSRINYSVTSKEWTPDKDGADSDFEYSRGDFTMTDGSHCMSGKYYHSLFDGINLILALCWL